MDQSTFPQFFSPAIWLQERNGPRYIQLFRHISQAIRDGVLKPDTQLPAERDIAEYAGVSRVTVRKAIEKLVAEDSISRQQGSGSFVCEIKRDQKLEHGLSALTSFTEYMRVRGKVSESNVLSAGLFAPFPDEIVTLGISSDAKVARVERLRSADNVPMAYETSSLPSDILPYPEDVTTSLYDILRRTGSAPVRAVQRISAANVTDENAELMGLPVGSAVLQIDRTGYLASGRPIEFTSGLYRSDIYDFIAELRLEDK